MDVILTAGGIPLPEEPLYTATQGMPKALVDVAGKPMVQWVLDALSGSKSVDNIIIVGLTEKNNLDSRKKMFFVPNQGKMVPNLQAGARKVLEVNPKARHVLLVSSDMPAITSEMVDWLVDFASKTDDDIYYCVVQRQVMEKRFPESRRTWTRLKDMEVCGGDLNLARVEFLLEGNTAIWNKITDARKNPLKQAALVGYDTAFLLLTGQLTLERAVEAVTTRLHITGQAVVCPYAEVGMDVDKPHQLEMVRADFKKRLKKEARPAPDGRGAAGRNKPAKKPAGSKAAGSGSKSSPVRKTANK